MQKISNIGNLLKKIYRSYSNDLLTRLELRGFTDLRPSFLEILTFISRNNGPSIKDIGTSCGLKKQTMTSHLNELTKRGYITRQSCSSDKRSQRVFLTEYGQKFKFSLLDASTDLEKKYIDQIGEVELNRVQFLLENFHKEISSTIH